MSAVSEDRLGLGGEQGVRERGRRKTGVNRGEQGSLGCLAMARLRPAPQPALEHSRFRPAPEGGTFPPRRLPVAVRRHAARPVEKGEIGFILGQRRQEIAELGQDREAYPQPSLRGSPACAMAQQPNDIRQAGALAGKRRRKIRQALGEDAPIAPLVSTSPARHTSVNPSSRIGVVLKGQV